MHSHKICLVRRLGWWLQASGSGVRVWADEEPTAGTFWTRGFLHQHHRQVTRIRRREQAIRQKSPTNPSLIPHKTNMFSSEQRAAGTSGMCCDNTEPDVKSPCIFKPPKDMSGCTQVSGLEFRRKQRQQRTEAQAGEQTRIPGLDNKSDGQMKE